MGLTLHEEYSGRFEIGYSEILKGKIARGYTSFLASLCKPMGIQMYPPSWRDLWVYGSAWRGLTSPCPGLDIKEDDQIKDLVLADLGNLLEYLKVFGPYVLETKVHGPNFIIQTVEANEYGLFRVSQTRGVKLTRSFVSAFMLFRTWEYQEPFNAPFDTSGLEEHMELIKTTPLRRL